MGTQFTFKLNDALYNAGILGFLRVCDNCGIEVMKKGAEIFLDQDDLEGFAEAYLETLIDTFSADIVYAEIKERAAQLYGMEKSEDFPKKFAEHFKYISEKLTRNSYKAAYQIIAARGENYDFEAAVKQIKSEKDPMVKYEIFLALLDKIKQYQDIFMLKDIAYTKVQPFWQGVSFLHKQKNQSEFATAYEDFFVSSARSFQPKAKNALWCCQCDAKLNKKEAYPMAWLNEVGTDTARKTNYFWNHNVDSYLCPLCNLIYSCLPLGFTMQGSEGIFINSNQSVRDLEALNAGSKQRLNANNQTDAYHLAIDRFLQMSQQADAKWETYNIQVVQRNSGGYLYTILSSAKLTMIKKCAKDFSAFLGRKILKDNEYVNLYRYVLNAVLNNQSLYPMMETILREAANSAWNVRLVPNLLNIQMQNAPEGDEKTVDNKKAANYSIMKQGEELRKAMSAEGRNENKIRTLTFHLLNHLNTRNPAGFMDSLARQCLAVSRPIPDAFINIFKDEELFLASGYAYVTGLNGGSSRKNQDGTENESKGEDNK